jgi:hypothetical protein
MEAWILRTLGTVGTLLFGGLLALTFYTPSWVEHAARDFITTEVQAEVDARITGVDVAGNARRLANAAEVLFRQNAERLDALKAGLRAKLHERIADALTEIRDVDCACRARIAGLLESGMLNSLSSLEAANARLQDFIQGRYLRVVAELKRDLRIFSATNAAAFALLLLLSFTKPRALSHLVFPGMLLAVAVLVSSYCYVFKQNWFFSIVYSDYWGFAYLGFLGFVFGLLLDIFLNHGRVTTRLGNGLLHSAGSAFSLAPC